MPFDIGLKEVLGESNLLASFIDDKNIQARFEDMLPAIDYILAEGPRYGYHLKKNKGAYLLGRCGSFEVARARKEHLISLGFFPDIIHIHPDDVPAELFDAANLEYGVKMVGTWIGSSEYIKSNLENKLQELNNEKNHIINFPDPQIRNLMFRWCFTQKINYLQRTISPDILADFVSQFELQKKDILCSLLKHKYTRDSLPDDIWQRARLHINDGGLGYRFAEDVTWSAYAASVFECSSLLDKIYPGFSVELEAAHLHRESQSIGVINDFAACLRFLTESTGVEHSADYIRFIWSNRNAEFSDFEAQHDKTIQSCIGKALRRTRVDQHKAVLISKGDTNDLAWFVSCQGSYPGRWLEMSPKTEHSMMTPREFECQLFYRLRLPNPFIIEGTRCSCKESPKIDVQGVHITTGCGKDGYRHRTHDNVARTIESMARICGIRTQIEEQKCFQEAFPDSMRRPDLSFTNAPKRHRKVVADLMVTGPVGTQVLSTTMALKEYRAADKAYADKCRSYKEPASANNLEFVALIFESTGKIHPETVKFVNDILEHHADGDSVRLGRLKRFWYTAISFSLQKHLAQSLLNRALKINGRHEPSFAFTDMAIERTMLENDHFS